MRGSGDRISRIDLFIFKKCVDGVLFLGFGLWFVFSCFFGKLCSEGGEVVLGLDVVVGSYWVVNCLLIMGFNFKYIFFLFGWIV